MPSSHQDKKIIPYHYHLMSLRLAKYPNSFNFWETCPFYEAKKGDLLTCIAPKYNPDLYARGPNSISGGTHVMVSAEIFENGGLLVIDSANRTRGRSYLYKENLENSKIGKQGGIGYSFLQIESPGIYEEENLRTCKWLGQKSKIKKCLSILRLKNIQK